jgi:steroid 5-alpha reductase family enzyme
MGGDMTDPNSREDTPLRPTHAVLIAVVSLAGVGFVAWALGRGGVRNLELPVMWFLAALSFAINWVAFVPAFAARTERFYDLTGSLTYLSVTAVAIFATGRFDTRGVALSFLVGAWALRLGIFLFLRVHADGGDRRFDELKQSGPRFFIAWTLQGVWVFLTLAAALTAITTPSPVEPGVWFVIGLVIWCFGFVFEVVADAQKRRFRRRKDKSTAFITTGLWAWSRHPNYFGEIVLWIGIAVMAAPTFSGWQWVALVSPVFVVVLLTKGSGVPLLEKRADEKWGGQPEYERYKARTPVLLPRPPGRED